MDFCEISSSHRSALLRVLLALGGDASKAVDQQMRLERLNIKLYIYALSWAFWSNKAGNAPPPPHHLLASADGDGSGVLSGMMLGDESSATGSRGRQSPETSASPRQ